MKKLTEELPGKKDWSDEGLFYCDGAWYGIALVPCEHRGVLEVVFPLVKRDSDTPATASKTCDKTSAPSKDMGGRPETALPLKELEQMAEKGLTVRAISKQLSFQGVDVSYRTVARRLKAGVE